MWANGQILQPLDVEHWIRDAYPDAVSFKAKVSEQEEPDKQRVRVTIEVVQANGQAIVHPVEPSRRACYHSLRDLAGMPQIDMEWE